MPSPPPTGSVVAADGTPDRRRIGVVSTGDPRSPRTWSGAPAALVAALERQGFEVVGIDAGTHGWRRAPFAARYHARRWWRSPTSAKVDLALQRRLLEPGLRSDLHWDLRLRARRSRHVLRQARAAGLDTVLHCTPNAIWDVPVPGLRQLAYLDATWAAQASGRVPGGPGRYPPALVEAGRAAEARTHPALDHVFVQGSWVLEHLFDLGVDPARTSVVGTGMANQARATAAAKVPGRMLLVVKDLEDERGVATTVEAFRIAHRARPDLELVLVGQASYVDRYGAEPGVVARPFVDRVELDRLLDECRLLVMPAAYQVWGMIYLEAMAAGAPILALDRLAVPEITEDGAFGFLVSRQDPAEVAGAMLDAFSDERRLAKVGEAARRSVRARFSWDRVAAKMAAVIDGGQQPEPGA